MDQHAIDELKAAGIVLDPETILRVPVNIDDDDHVVALQGDEVPVHVAEDRVVLVKLRPITALYAGSRKAPSFYEGPTREYAHFFAAIEATAVDCASFMRPIPKDQELERIYRLLKRHPDGRDRNPLFSYVQAAARLYMSLRDVSRDVFEASVSRIALCAKHLSTGPLSTNYFDRTAEMFLGEREPQGFVSWAR